MTFEEHAHILKEEILSAVHASVQRFQEHTGVSPKGIDLETAEVTAMGDTFRRYHIIRVRLEFEL